MVDILDRPNRHLLLEEQNNTNNSFIANVNILVADLDKISAVADSIDNVNKVFECIDEVTNVANSLDDIRKANSLKPALETVASISDNITTIVTQLDVLRSVYAKLGDITSVANQFPTIQNRLTDLETLSDSMTQQQNELAEMLARGETNADRLSTILSQATAKLGEITNALDEISDIRTYIQGVKDDIEAALRDAVLPVITDELKTEIVDAASAQAVDVIEQRLLGDTDFVQTYINNYNDTTSVIEGGYDIGNTDFVGTYDQTYNENN